MCLEATIALLDWNCVLLSKLREEAVLVVSAVLAALSMLLVPPDAAYVSYFDTRVLILLFCLMSAVAGLRASGLFAVCAQRLLQGERTFGWVVLVLVALPFFASMLVTNDVALLAFVPFSIVVLKHAGRQQHLAWVVVLQAVAANLGGMATPVGNPQNLFLYMRYNLSLTDFMLTVLPYTAVALIALCIVSLISGKTRVSVEVPLDVVGVQRTQLICHLVLFVLCLLTVVHVLNAVCLLLIVIAVLMVADRPILREVDYGLLLTFVCFFIFAGNLGRLEIVRNAFEQIMNCNALLASVVTSQVISNVPAAVLLSEFTGNWASLLLGVDIGGLGTPIASLASLIALRLFLHADKTHLVRFLVIFIAVNGAFLLLLLGFHAVWTALMSCVV